MFMFIKIYLIYIGIGVYIEFCDVDLSYPPGVEPWKGSAVRRLKGYMSWV